MPAEPSRSPQASPLLDPAGIDALRTALAGYTTGALYADLPADAADGLGRGDLPRLRRHLPATGRLATLVRLFVLADEVDERAARDALAPLPLEQAVAAGLVRMSAGSVRALLDLRPHEDERFGADWWVLSDFGTDVRPGPVEPDHVLGIGAASLALSGAVVPLSGGRALDIGTGCGISALPLGAQGAAVVATDVSRRALRFAATAAALAGQDWDLRLGSLTEPVAGETFDTIISNPPFVVSPGLGPDSGGLEYRDSGQEGDGVVRELLRTLPDRLAVGGTAQLLANWVIPPDGAWDTRVTAWLADRGVDAWIWQREALDPVAYVTLWLRDAGEDPASPRWADRFEAWLDWFRRSGVSGVGMGVVSMRRVDRAGVVVCEDVRQSLDDPSGPEIAGWLARTDWLARRSDDALLATAFRCGPDVTLVTTAQPEAEGWTAAAHEFRQTAGLRFAVPTDQPVSALVSGCDGRNPLRLLVAVLAGMLDQPVDAVAQAVLPVVRDLVQRGILLPPAEGGA